MKKRFLIAFGLLAMLCSAQENHKYDSDIATIKKYDNIYEPAQNPILFVGSSSIRKWGHLQEAFGNYNVINRGIGGAVTDDITHYVDDLVFKYKPRQIVLYVGENDLPDNTKTDDIILQKTISLYTAIRAKLPEVPIVYIAMKPSPLRDNYQQKCKAANDKIRKFLSTEKNAVFVDVYTPMLANGKSRPELFVEDMLHMNAKGYSIWEEAVAPYLLKEETAKKKM
ncbi:GDSL-type esterase/lipase family protein [Flavobacterium sp. RHBU_24]|uniref:GDSL-type esterase/lipase family protein n=1 Tax=Flavobacterium sp. RHBU_24 TaxID=3391185 RepID=UPI0039846D25